MYFFGVVLYVFSWMGFGCYIILKRYIFFKNDIYIFFGAVLYVFSWTGFGCFVIAFCFELSRSERLYVLQSLYVCKLQ